LGNLPNLVSISIKCCDMLSHLSDNMYKLVKLEHLEIYNCNKLKNLPKDIQKLYNLKCIIISSCCILEHNLSYRDFPHILDTRKCMIDSKYILSYYP